MKRLVASVIALVVLLGGCTGGRELPPPKSPPAIDDAGARGALDEVVKDISANGVVDFCGRLARDAAQCEDTLGDALRACLLPGDAPRVLRSAPFKRAGSEEGWVLEVAGRTMDGQAYTSEFFVVHDQDRVRPAVGVFWTGLGLVDSPFGPHNTKVPQRACP
ncbi:hypothetical protein [Nonomuraea sp. NPDC048826]|uniref:hypothetical protein n=1 Tax=Nonomuraea sp. NPDC048826 TaxID=3364347 RepID=UPI00371D4853